MTLCQNEWHRAHSAAMCAAQDAPREQKLAVGIFLGGKKAHWDVQKWSGPGELRGGRFLSLNSHECTAREQRLTGSPLIVRSDAAAETRTAKMQL